MNMRNFQRADRRPSSVNRSSQVWWRCARLALVVVVLSAPGLTPPPARAQSTDTIQLVSGRPLRGEIVSSNPQGVDIKTADGTVTVPVHDVRRITFADEPRELQRAREDFIVQRYNSTVDLLTKIEQPPKRTLIEEDMAYLAATAAARLAISGEQGTIDEAAAKMAAYLQAYPATHHLYSATETFGELALARGRFDAAEVQFQKLIDAPLEPIQLIGLVYGGLAKLRLENYADAIKLLEQAEAMNVTDESSLQWRLIAKCYRAQALGLSGQVEQGLQLAQEIIANESANNGPVFARAYNALGACHLQQDDTTAAILDYLHTDLLYFTEADPHAEALYHIHRLSNQQNQTDRANEARDTLTSRYGHLHWATKQ
jgi:tetratricopeptide (TPR) repeat protein